MFDNSTDDRLDFTGKYYMKPRDTVALVYHSTLLVLLQNSLELSLYSRYANQHNEYL